MVRVYVHVHKPRDNKIEEYIIFSYYTYYVSFGRMGLIFSIL